MKKLFFILSIGYVIISCSNNESHEVESGSTVIENNSVDQQETNATAKDISAEEFKSKVDNTPGQLIDVRTPEEFANGTIEGAINLNFYAEDFSSLLDNLDKNQPVYVFCQSGGRSGKAMKTLEDKGFTVVYNLIGGYGSWPYK